MTALSVSACVALHRPTACREASPCRVGMLHLSPSLCPDPMLPGPDVLQIPVELLSVLVEALKPQGTLDPADGDGAVSAVGEQWAGGACKLPAGLAACGAAFGAAKGQAAACGILAAWMAGAVPAPTSMHSPPSFLLSTAGTTFLLTAHVPHELFVHMSDEHRFRQDAQLHLAGAFQSRASNKRECPAIVTTCHVIALAQPAWWQAAAQGARL